jgi:ribosomal protein S18 acetylase RimI-like enzyme
MPLVVRPEWIGRRVVVRRVLASDAGARFSDTVGDLVRVDDDQVEIDSARGTVRIDRAVIAEARLVEASTAAQLDLERIAAEGWRAADTEWIGGWLMRADHGWTGRANSALPLRAPGRPMAEMVAATVGWYAQRGLRARIHVPMPARRLLERFLADTPFRERDEVPEIGTWQPGPWIDVLTGRLDHMPAQFADGVTIASTPDPEWLALCRDGTVPASGTALLARHERVAFVEVRAGGEVAAIVRGAVDEGWLGVTGLEVAIGRRCQGYGRAAMAAVVRWARTEYGASRGYLQVDAANTAAAALYSSLGWWPHHAYRYWDHTPRS